LNDLEALNDILQQFTLTHILEQPPARVLVSEFGGRILGVDLGFGNLLWVHPELQKVLQQKQWNLGGARTWFSPERFYFYRQPEDFTNWFCQPGLDPAAWQFKQLSQNKIELLSPLRFTNFLTAEVLNGTIRKVVELLGSYEESSLLECDIKVHSEAVFDACQSPLALWFIVQVPVSEEENPSHVSVPINDKCNPIDHFSSLPEKYLNVSANEVVVTLDGKNELKVGIRPEDLKDPTQQVMKYYYLHDGNQVLLSLHSQTGARTQKECLDVPRSDVHSTTAKAVIQVYNSDKRTSGLKYGELEIHSRPAFVENGKKKLVDEYLLSFEVERRA